MLGIFHVFCTMSLRVGVNIAHWLNPCTTGCLACGRLLFNGLLLRRPIRAARCLHKRARVRCTCVCSSRLCALRVIEWCQHTIFHRFYSPCFIRVFREGTRDLQAVREMRGVGTRCTTSSDESRPRCTRGRGRAAWIAGSLVQRLARVLVMWPPSQLAWQVTMVC
jgi:hypothetical protein